ncbi:unnamed protein product [Musa acuminata subsp. burmannicoides]
MLRRAIEGNSVFLVLDDVWRADVWVNLLRTPLSSAMAIRRILITTRDRKIANQMGAVHIHNVKLLREDEGWELLCRSASLQRKKDIQDLRDIGIGIVRKCHGLPLAIKTMGGVLITKEKSRREWEKVLDNDAWTMSKLPEELKGALYLSYEDLPSHLKQCFLYFALFPEDYEFLQEDLVKLWVAEGFVENEGSKLLEETAKEYYTEFIRRSILQPNPGFESTQISKVHDLLRSLAQFLAEDECAYGNAREIKFPTKQKLRRLSMTEEGNVATIPEVVSRQNCLRTVMLFRSPTTVLNESLVRLRCLRCLSLRGTATRSIPNSIGNLIHLRYLDLRSTSVSRLPETIGQLTNLQVLDLCFCEHLCTLPQGITRLCNLRCLDLFMAPLEHLPAGIMKLKQLNFLSGFVISEGGNVGNQMLSVCDLEELRSLDRLRHLRLDRLERYSSNGTSLLLNKSLLQRLRLSCTSAVERQYSEEETNQIQHVFDNLKPPPGLDDLIIEGFFGRKNPSWMQSSSLVTCFPCLRCLTLQNFASCLQLPPLGELPHLQYLKIIGANSVLRIGPEFLGDDAATSTAFFPELKSLIIAKMPNWEEWSLHRGGEAEEEIAAAPERPLLLLPNLEIFSLRNCPKLRSLPQGLLDHATKLSSLFIEGANELKAVENLPSLSGLLQTKDCPSLERISNLGALGTLDIIGCPSLVCRLPEWLPGLAHQPNSSLVVVVVCDVRLLERCIRGGEDWHIVQQKPVVSLYADTDRGTDVWVNLLRTPLSSAMAIRRILITTRDRKIANQMGAVHIHNVKLLREDEGWELLCRSASLQRKKDIRDLRDIGIGIVRKCHGLPLAIKTMGGVLMTKEKSRGEWEKVLDNGAWTMSKLLKELKGALYLSYEDLPSHLKQCFLYFALFPEDHEFHREDIVRQWVAEEYIENEGSRLPEETAEEYYTEFIRRSIIQPNPGHGNIKTTKVHDLLLSLARYLAEDECSNVNAREIKFPTKQKILRLWKGMKGMRQNCLRTVMLFKSPTTVLNEFSVRLRCLRCLSLRGTATGSIPNSIGNLIHLRYLDLCSTSVSRLPETIGQLTNLQVLDLRFCTHLCTLPQGITRLCNLRCLHLFMAPLEHLPAGIIKLKQLNFHSGFVIGERGNVGNRTLSVCDLEELKYLDRLRHLRLDKLERCFSNGTSLLLNKSLLQRLRLSCTSERQYSKEETNRIQHVFDNLKPPPGLDDLIIVGFFGRKIPS